MQMDIILKERNCQEKTSGGKIFAFIVGVVFLINIIVVAINRLTPLAAGVASILLILLVMGIAYKVMTGKVTEYYYILTPKGLLFHRAMGIREIALMEIPFDSILHFKPIEDYRGDVKLYYFLCNRKDDRRKLLVFNHKGETAGVVFSPSREMAEAIMKKTGNA